LLRSIPKVLDALLVLILLNLAQQLFWELPVRRLMSNGPGSFEDILSAVVDGCLLLHSGRELCPREGGAGSGSAGTH
jgi:hypothetical protein